MKKEGKRKELFSFNLPLKNRKGLSAIVATLIIILLVLVAAGIIWVVVRNIISEGAEGIELGRFTLDLSIKSAYIDGTNVKVLVKRNVGGGDLVGIRFIFFNGTHSISVDRKIPLIELQERLFSFDSSEVGDINALQEVSIAPIYESSSGRETVGDITDTATISDSPPLGGNGDNGDNGDNGGTGDPDTGYCGDTAIQYPNANGVYEVCDGTNLGGQDCISQGFDGGGPLTCNSDCLSFDTSLCTQQAPDSCNGTCNPPEDPGVECDAGPNCGSDCVCLIGFTADTFGGCDLDPEISTGTIYSVWNRIYFDSNDFPKSQVTMGEYIGYYVNFSTSDEIACFRINFADYVTETDISYVRLDDSLGFPNINSDGDIYHVWEAENCGA